MKLLNIEKLNASYDKFEVLRDVGFHADEGEIVSLIGPNGAGKSSVLKSIFGFLNITKGKISFYGKDITKLQTHQLAGIGISFVHQGRQVFRKMSVEENLELGAFIDNYKKNNIEKIYKIFPILKEKRIRNANELSGGQQQMLAIGRALMLEPKLLLLDEPSLGLDPKTTKLIFNKIKEINKSGTTILLVEQNAHMALEISNRAYIVENGSIKLGGKAKQLSRRKDIKKLYLGG